MVLFKFFSFFFSWVDGGGGGGLDTNLLICELNDNNYF